MKNKGLKLAFVALLMGGALTACGNTTSAQPTLEVKDSYTFIFDVNYDGGKDRTISVDHGKKASYYNARRSGYILDNWYNEEACTSKFDFSTAIIKDTTVYAKWIKEEDVINYDVTFDFNYAYEGAPYILSVRNGTVIESDEIPTSTRLGFEISGWYLDEACTQPFNLATPITGNTTLYAGYERSTEIKYDTNGDPIFENVVINYACVESFGISDDMKNIINLFNLQYDGKIKVNLVEQTNDSDSTISLKFHQSEVFTRTSNTYYSMAEVLDLAGVDFDETQYYKNQIADSYMDGRLFTMPIGSFVPMIYYNKDLMNKYNSSGVLPTNSADMLALLKAVDSGEAAAQGSNWTDALVMSEGWDMKEITSHAIYVQNDANFYKDVNGELKNEWLDSEGKIKDNVFNAVKRFREFFVSTNSYNAPGKVEGTYDKGMAQYVNVGAGKAFMGISGIPTQYPYYGTGAGLTDSAIFNKIGAMPLSNFFAVDNSKECADDIFVKNFALGVYKSGPKDLNKIAAAGVFANYVSQNLKDVMNKAIYPANKNLQAKVFESTDYRVTNILRNCGKPENFICYPGHPSEYQIFNYLNEQLMPLLVDATNDDETIKIYLELTAKSIKEALEA